ELGLIYRLAPIVFVGGLLASPGGQNPIEPVKLGAAILHGPDVWNFCEAYAALDEARGAGKEDEAGQVTQRAGAWLKGRRTRAGVPRSWLPDARALPRSAAGWNARLPRSNRI